MNTEKVQQEISNIISELHTRIGGKAARKQYPVAKHQMATLEELGILDLMPSGFGHSDAKAVIEAAQADEQVGFNSYGEGDVTSASSKLYDLLHEANEEETEFAIAVDGNGGTQSSSYYGGYSEGSQINIWKAEDSTWSWCISGVSNDGNYYETDDYDNCQTKEEAESAARDYLEQV